MSSVVRNRLLQVAQESRKMAAECRTKSSFDFGVNEAFDIRGAPCCVWGHTLARTGYRTKYGIISNITGLTCVVRPNDEWTPPSDFGQELTDPCTMVSRANDDESKSDEDRLHEVSTNLELVADAIERYVEKHGL